eukprot:scaffold31708_cov242-Isochrysis_galbana.AAC.4
MQFAVLPWGCGEQEAGRVLGAGGGRLAALSALCYEAASCRNTSSSSRHVACRSRAVCRVCVVCRIPSSPPPLRIAGHGHVPRYS